MSMSFVGGSETAVAEKRSVEETQEIVNKLIADENECIEHFDFAYGLCTETTSNTKHCVGDCNSDSNCVHISSHAFSHDLKKNMYASWRNLCLVESL